LHPIFGLKVGAKQGTVRPIVWFYICIKYGTPAQSPAAHTTKQASNLDAALFAVGMPLLDSRAIRQSCHQRTSKPAGVHLDRPLVDTLRVSSSGETILVGQRKAAD